MDNDINFYISVNKIQLFSLVYRPSTTPLNRKLTGGNREKGIQGTKHWTYPFLYVCLRHYERAVSATNHYISLGYEGNKN